MRNASLFNKGYEMSELLSAALLDMRWHCLEENEAMQDVDDFELRGAGGGKYGSSCYTATLSQQLFRPIFLVADMPQVITLICGHKCWPMMVISGLLSRAD
ncbi:dipeptidyl carboxypeptidase II [Escherichia coli]|uniref:Dipeptidyl carboxypeptidase II n=1 Tax=Escherichia coli TaxID=562 RepID=A0A376KVW9_ECOLX|nr:dipeptidyl carboxypeptidase II [Escherichia coli]